MPWCAGFYFGASGCGAQVPGLVQASVAVAGGLYGAGSEVERCMGLLAPQHVGSSQSQSTPVSPASAGRFLSLCRQEVLLIFSLEQSIFLFFFSAFVIYKVFKVQMTVFWRYLFCSTSLFSEYSFIYSGQLLIFCFILSYELRLLSCFRVNVMNFSKVFKLKFYWEFID